MRNRYALFLLMKLVLLGSVSAFAQTNDDGFAYQYKETEQTRPIVCGGVSDSECLSLLLKEAQDSCVGYFFGESLKNGLGPPATLLLGRLWSNDSVKWVFGTGVELGYIWRLRMSLRSQPCVDPDAYQDGKTKTALPTTRTLYLKKTQHFLSLIGGPGLNIVSLQTFPGLEPEAFSASVSVEVGIQYQLAFTDTDGAKYSRKTLSIGLSFVPAYGFARQIVNTPATSGGSGNDGSQPDQPSPSDPSAVKSEWHPAGLLAIALRIGANF